MRKTLPVDQIYPNPDNPRTIQDEKFLKLVQSLKDFPEMLDARELVVNKEHIVLGGNMRLKAAKEAGIEELPVKVVDWPEDKQREFVIKDNASFGDWNWEELAEEWNAEELVEWGLDLSDDFLDREAENVGEDDAPEVDEEYDPISEPGKVYQLGRHRLIVGDATNPDHLAKLSLGQQYDLYLTDPPYNVAYNDDSPANLKGRRRRKDTLTILNDNFESSGHFKEFLKASFKTAIDQTKPGAPFYIFHADMESPSFRAATEEAGWSLRQNLVWVKSQLVLGRQDYHWQHEPILYGWKPGAAHKWYGDFKKTTIFDDQPDIDKLKLEEARDLLRALFDTSSVIREDRPMKSGDHPTMKPLKLLSRIIQNSTGHGALILDSFGGSGSTLMAADAMGRTCHTMELDPRYADVIRKRYYKSVTGEEEGWVDGTPEAEA